MEQSKLVAELDAFFALDRFDERAFWSGLPDEFHLVFNRYASPSFVEGPGNGLLLNHTDKVERVYLAVSPTQAILDKIVAREIERDSPGALLFVHRAIPYARSAADAIMPESLFSDLREQNVSLYVCHAPLNKHPEISTASAAANALRLREQERFTCSETQRIGVRGRISLIPFQKFAERAAKACEVTAFRYDQICHMGRTVERVAVVPGAGDDADLIRAAADLKCDTYISGEWWPFDGNDTLESKRNALMHVTAKVQINLLGIGRYQSELLVLRDQVLDWFKQRGMDTQLLRELSEVGA